MTRRPGLTLVEMQVTIFVTMIGLTGVIAMFPVGAKWMGDGLNTDRTTQHALSMDALVRNEWKTRVVEDPNQSGGNEPYWVAMDDPTRTVSPYPATPHPTNTVVPPVPTNSSEPSYPVFLDPMGWLRTTNNRNWVGDPGVETFVPRRTMNTIGTSNPSLALWMWSEKNGFGYDEDGRPLTNYDAGGNPTTSAEMRELRYNALVVLQRPTNRDRNSATLKVVVYNGRRHQFFPTDSEPRYTNVAFVPGSTQLQLPTSADVGKGRWLMDATVGTANGGVGQIRHANFYRVVSATDNGAVVGGVPMYDIELHTPIVRTDGRNNPATDSYPGTVVVLTGARDVFDCPMLVGGTNP